MCRCQAAASWISWLVLPMPGAPQRRTGTLASTAADRASEVMFVSLMPAWSVAGERGARNDNLLDRRQAPNPIIHSSVLVVTWSSSSVSDKATMASSLPRPFGPNSSSK